MLTHENVVRGDFPTYTEDEFCFFYAYAKLEGNQEAEVVDLGKYRERREQVNDYLSRKRASAIDSRCGSACA